MSILRTSSPVVTADKGEKRAETEVLLRKIAVRLQVPMQCSTFLPAFASWWGQHSDALISPYIYKSSYEFLPQLLLVS